MSRNPDLTLFIHTPYHGIGEMISPDFATSLTLRGIARDKKPVARESKRTIAKVSAPVPLVMGQVLRFYVVALRC